MYAGQWQEGACAHLEMGLHREGFIQELLVKVLFGLVDQNAGHAVVIELRSAGSAHHLQDVGDGEIHVAPKFAIEKLSALQ